jgi:hypothetical protein
VLLAATVLAYLVVNFIVRLVLPPTPGPWQLQLGIAAVFMLFWYAVLLRTFGKSERFLQTVTAMFGYQVVLAPLWIATLFLSGRFTAENLLQFPVAIMGLALAIWIIRAGSYILKAALELPMAACVVLVILQILTGELLMIALSPSPPPSTTETPIQS